MRRLGLSVAVRAVAAALALWALRTGLDHLAAPLSVWLTAPLAFGLAKLAGDVTILSLFKDSVVFFYEDLFWEFVAFIALGLLSAVLITIAQNLIGGPVQPYVPALGVYVVYLLAEVRERRGAEGRQGFR